MPVIRLLRIQWEGPLSMDAVLAKAGDEDYGLYQIYAHHLLFSAAPDRGRVTVLRGILSSQRPRQASCGVPPRACSAGARGCKLAVGGAQ